MTMKTLFLLAAACPTAALHVASSQHIRPPTALFGLLGRFRQQRKVEQVQRIEPGATIPVVDVEKLTVGEDGSVTTEVVSIQDVLGNSKAILVGMPGAFTPTCDKEHLPGYIKSADKLASLGIERIAVVTTNDRFVNEVWSSQQGLLSDGAKIVILCDGDGDLVKSMGLADDMGFGVGVRSKRFAMVTNNGQVVELLTDEGMNDCSVTSAANLVELLTPDPVVEPDATEIDGKLIGAAGFALMALVASQVMGGSAPSPAPTPVLRPAPQIRAEPTKKAAQPETSFSLLEQYLSD